MEKELTNGSLKLTPSQGKTLVCLTDGRAYSEVVCSAAKRKNYAEVPA